MLRLKKHCHARSALRKHEWSFAEVPQNELLACCYWEYARESASICGAIQNRKDVDAGKASREPREIAELGLARLNSIGTAAELVFHAKFPKPWQSLPESERTKLASRFKPEFSSAKIPAFQVINDLGITGELHNRAKQIQKALVAINQRLWEIDAVDPSETGEKESSELREKRANLSASPIVHGEGGVDSFVAQINWRAFTDKEIAITFKRWISRNRPVPVESQPKGLRGVTGGRGHDPDEWRASLERLGIMRLMHSFSPSDLADEVQSALPAESADREKYSSKAGNKKERQKALNDFYQLFPSLDNEKPKSWEMVADGW